MDEGSLSPGGAAESDERHWIKDEKRLQLDLAKHQELLLDSQKMNQSIKRCLALTEDLTIEGRKALDYRVYVSDVELGGRVLEPDELEDHEVDPALLCQPSEERMSTAWEEISKRLSLDSERDDRDSGVELENTQRAEPAPDSIIDRAS